MNVAQNGSVLEGPKDSYSCLAFTSQCLLIALKYDIQLHQPMSLE
jgi:hypothetical protein